MSRRVLHVPAGLAENRCLNRRANGCTLLQVGEQDVAFGAKFRARVVLDIQVLEQACCGEPHMWPNVP